MATFLELVQELVTELGIGGANQGATVPVEVINQTGQLWNAVNWVIKANNNINLLHTDWQYLATEYSEPLTIASTAVTAHTGSEIAKMWDRRSFWVDRAGTRAAPLTWMNWEEFRADILPGLAPTSNSKPSIITQKRDGSLIVDVPCDLAYALTAEFYKVPTLLAVDADVPEMPAEYHRLIVCEAAIKYGNKEAALEVINGMEAEYAYLIEKMEGDQLIGGEYDMQHSQDIPIVMDIPGFDETQDRGTKWWL
jgi:hypothetical protein